MSILRCKIENSHGAVMKMRSINLSEHEVLAALDDKLGLVVRPVKPQPIEICLEDGLGLVVPQTPRGCPLGVPGDRLRCKETWCCPIDTAPQTAVYRADYPDCVPSCYENIPQPATLSWRSPATMPAWASRITLEVGDVRCCRLHQLCEDDFRMVLGEPMGAPASHELYTEILALFKTMWRHRYGKRYPWESNPFVWAAKVKRVEG